MVEHVELPAKLLDYFLRSHKSNINQSLNVVVLVSCLNLLHYNDVSVLTVYQGAAPLPTSCHVPCETLLSCLSVVHMCGLGLCLLSGLVYDLQLTSEVVEGFRLNAHCQKSILDTILTSTAWKTPG